MRHIRILILAFILFGSISCNQNNAVDEFNYFPIKSKWTFIEPNNKSGVIYSEIEFKENRTLTIVSESDGQLGPFKYSLTGNTLTFNKLSFSVTLNEDASITLKSRDKEFILYNIPFEESSISTDQLNPFVIRRCYFLVNLGFITTDDAIEYLSSITIIEDSDINEELIISNKK